MENTVSLDNTGIFNSNYRVMFQLDKYLSSKRKETIVKATKCEIQYPKSLINMQDAVDSIIQSYDGKRNTFLAAGILVDNEQLEHANLFNTVFGRDSLIMLDFLRIIEHKNEFYPKSKKAKLPKNLERDVLFFLASYQGQETNPNSEEVFGKILHEYRKPTDPIAIQLNAERNWEFPYFGAIDSTFYFIKSLSIYLKKNPKQKNRKILNQLSGKEYTLLQCLINATNYSISMIKDGLIQYSRTNSQGIEIQSWRDSYDAVSDSMGRLPDYDVPMCLLDIQLVAIEAFEEVSSLFLLLGEIIKYTAVQNLSNKLKIGLNKELWVNVDDENGYFAMGMQMVDGKKRLFDCVSSSNLIILAKNFVSPAKKAKIFNYCYPKLRVKNGIATIATDEERYHSSGYHTGNVWIFDNILAIFGLLAFHKMDEARDVLSCIDRIINETNCYPELVGSDDTPNQYIIDIQDEIDGNRNRISQPGQPMQGWSIMGYLAIKTIMD
jgi:glycogen debranching enzyme